MVMQRAAARCGEWAQHFSNASCIYIFIFITIHGRKRNKQTYIHKQVNKTHRKKTVKDKHSLQTLKWQNNKTFISWPNWQPIIII